MFSFGSAIVVDGGGGREREREGGQNFFVS